MLKAGKFSKRLAKSMEVCRVEFVVDPTQERGAELRVESRGRKAGDRDTQKKVLDGRVRITLSSGEVVKGWRLRNGDSTPYYGIFLADQVEKRRDADFAAMHTIPHPEGYIDPRTGEVMLLTPYSLAVLEGRGDEFCESQYKVQYKGKGGKRFDEDRF
jgi:hypothetical protein